jgi:alpha-methylacyl-CoA racemase
MNSGPLRGVRIVEMAGIGPVPLAAMILSDLGAEVIRIDRLDTVHGSGAENRHSYLRGRRSMGIDLSAPEAAELMLTLLSTSDALVEGFRPGVMERLGLGPDVCLARSPRLVYGRMTGWGQTGPLAQAAGHDINYIALAGVLDHIGGAECPVVPLNLVGDYGGGSMFLVTGVLASLLEVQRGGDGQVVDAAMLDGASLLMTPTHDMLAQGNWTLDRESNLLDGAAPFYTIYGTADGKHMAVGAIEPKFYAVLLAGLGLDPDELPGQFDRPQWPSMRARLASIFRSKTRGEWTRIFEGTDACVTPVLSMAEAPRHPHAAHRGSFLDIGSFRDQPSPAPRLSKTPASPGGEYAAGAAAREILEELGYPADERDRLIDRHVVG